MRSLRPRKGHLPILKKGHQWKVLGVFFSHFSGSFPLGHGTLRVNHEAACLPRAAPVYPEASALEPRGSKRSARLEHCRSGPQVFQLKLVKRIDLLLTRDGSERKSGRRNRWPRGVVTLVLARVFFFFRWVHMVHVR